MNFESLIKSITSNKKHTFELVGDEIKGDYKSLDRDLFDFDPEVGNTGIGEYEYWGARSKDVKLELVNDFPEISIEIKVTDEKINKDDIVELFMDGLKRSTYEFESEKLNADFKAITKDIKLNNKMINFSLVWKEV
jgi:hypothetical protein